MDHGSIKQSVKVNLDWHKSTHNLLQVFNMIPKCSSSNLCYFCLASAFCLCKAKLRNGDPAEIRQMLQEEGSNTVKCK